MKKLSILLLLAVVVFIGVRWWKSQPAQDEAMQAGKTPADFPVATDDYFHDMDGGVPMTAAEIEGRNTWMVWAGGNQAFWDYLANNSFGTFDLLKTLSSYPCSTEQEKRAAQYEGEGAYAAAVPGYETTSAAYSEDAYGEGYDGKKGYSCAVDEMYPDLGRATYRNYTRETRFCYSGLINEPGFRQATKPDEFGLCLDEQAPGASVDNFDREVYGEPTGVLGLRLFPNPNFDGKAARTWAEAQKRDAFYLDEDFYADRKLVRPYRVGMSCAFCHVSHHPLHPPADQNAPEFANLSGTIGAQYFWFGRVFGANLTPDNIVWHALDAQQPGAVDTSFIPTDYILNPRAMNGVFGLPSRVQAAKDFHRETAAGGALNLPEIKRDGPTVAAPQILWDGSDSVGVDAALTRVYINIGEAHQEWIRHITPLTGLRKQTPIEVKVLQENSVFWNATQERMDNMLAYLIKASAPMRLKDVDGGAGLKYLQGERDAETYEAALNRGKVVFAENCARCHSSKLPAKAKQKLASCKGAGYMDCWKQYWEMTGTPGFKSEMTAMVMASDFLDDNYLSTDARIPVQVSGDPDFEGALHTEICSSMASNAIAGHVWDNFSSTDYKSLPDIGQVTLQDPIGNREYVWKSPGGGRGYMHVASLISAWSTAPFLHNNEIGDFTGNPSVEGRLVAFDSGIRKMLKLDPREGIIRRVTHKDDYGRQIVRDCDPATPDEDCGVKLAVNRRALPLGLGYIIGDLEIGPIPDGTPVSLLVNANIDRTDDRFSLWRFLKLGWNVKRDLFVIQKKGLTGDDARDVLKNLVPDLIENSACPDLIVDRGHNFGTDLSEADKYALIDFLKTL